MGPNLTQTETISATTRFSGTRREDESLLVSYNEILLEQFDGFNSNKLI